jgi:hypothetical protein
MSGQPQWAEGNGLLVGKARTPGAKLGNPFWECCCAWCARCDPPLERTYTVTIDGYLADPGAPCDYTAFNGAFDLDALISPYIEQCRWYKNAIPWIYELAIAWNWPSAGGWNVFLQFYGLGGYGITAIFRHDTTEKCPGPAGAYNLITAGDVYPTCGSSPTCVVS